MASSISYRHFQLPISVTREGVMCVLDLIRHSMDKTAPGNTTCISQLSLSYATLTNNANITEAITTKVFSTHIICSRQFGCDDPCCLYSGT